MKLGWPVKTREIHNHHLDATIWNDLQFRDDDIVIASYAQAGTTWMQQIIAQLLFDGDPDLEVAEMSPWMDLRVPPKEFKLPYVRSWWHICDLPNVLLVHFTNLKQDMPVRKSSSTSV